MMSGAGGRGSTTPLASRAAANRQTEADMVVCERRQRDAHDHGTEDGIGGLALGEREADAGARDGR